MSGPTRGDVLDALYAAGHRGDTAPTPAQVMAAADALHVHPRTVWAALLPDEGTPRADRD